MGPDERRRYLADTCRRWLEAALTDGLPDSQPALEHLGWAMSWAGEIRPDKTAGRCAEATWKCARSLYESGLATGVVSITLVAERQKPSMTTLLAVLDVDELLAAQPG